MSCQYFSPCDHGAQSFTIMMPKLTFGRGCLREVGERVAARGYRKVALFTDPYLKEGPYVATATQSLVAQGIRVEVFSDIRIEPDDVSILNGATFIKEGDFDCVVSVGGGSAMDTAKAAMLYALFPSDFTDYFGAPVGAGKPIPGPLLPHFACPTTSGTGSECTSVSVIRLTEHNSKFVIGSPHLVPTEAIIDPECTDTLSANAIASTGFDLLCHALECYTAKAYTQWDHIDDPNKRPLLQGANPWSDMAARRALEIAGKYLVRGVNDNSDADARDNLMWGASLAGMAFGNSGTHLPHAMSYGITHLMEDITTDGYPVASPFIPHGISVAISAPAIFKYLSEGAPLRHLEAATFLGANTVDACPDDAGELVEKQLIQMMRESHIPNGLNGVGFSANDVKALSDSSIRQSRAIANAPRDTNLVDMQNIYNNALSYW
ncbi:MAG: hydroxyacid-oxoacid transhydrogenase [Neolewinella sp.]|jgi:hydroxyacid-oxoacid transhydrogenase